MVSVRHLGLWLALALGLAPLSCTPLDLDGIACSGHGQCPTGYHCDVGSGQLLGMNSVCVLGEARAAGFGASMLRFEIPASGRVIGQMAALHTNLLEFPRLHEAINEDVLEFPLLFEAEDRGEGQLENRYRPGGASLYSPAEGLYLPEGSRPVVRFIVPSLADQDAADLPFGAAGSAEVDATRLNCGQQARVSLSNSPQTLAAGSSWAVASMFSTGGGGSGPAMPTAPNPQGAQLVGGRILLLPGTTLRLQDPEVDRDPLSEDVFLVMGDGFDNGNSSDCSEADCDDSRDNDGDLLIDCEDPDCEGLSSRNPDTGVIGICGETSCGDGIDNDENGSTDCQDPNCQTVECPPPPADLAAYPVSDDGWAEVSWEALPESLSEEGARFLMVWGRARKRVVLDTVEGRESALLSASQWQAYEVKALEATQYIVGIELQQDAALPGQIRQLAVEPIVGVTSWQEGADYQVKVADGFGHETFAFRDFNDPVMGVVVADNSIHGQLDVTRLCRGLARVEVTATGFAAEDEVCSNCGVGTLDNRRPNLHCDVPFPSGLPDVTLSMGQVGCGSFDSGGGQGEAHRYKFDAVAGTTYQIEILAKQLSQDLDPNIQIELQRDDNGDFQTVHLGEWGLVFSEQDYCDSDPRLMWQCPVSGRYQVKLEPNDSQDGGGFYKLLVEPL